MRARPFVSAGESPRLFGEVLGERRAMDPAERALDATLAEVRRLEGEAAEAADPNQRKQLQCEAEALRCAIDENRGRR